MATTAGVVALNIQSYTPTGPNPSNTEWVPCVSNWIYFHQKSDGTAVEDKYIERMLGIALAAFKTNTPIRVAIKRDEAGKCYTSQIFDLGD